MLTGIKPTQTTEIAVARSQNTEAIYTIKLGKDGNIYCSCPAWKYQKCHPHTRTCKHIMAAWNTIWAGKLP